MSDELTLGQRLRLLRLSDHNNRGEFVPLRQAARIASVSPVQWSHFENDRERPDRDWLIRICPLFGADLGELLRLWEQWQEAPPIDLSANICRKVWDPASGGVDR